MAAVGERGAGEEEEGDQPEPGRVVGAGEGRAAGRATLMDRLAEGSVLRTVEVSSSQSEFLLLMLLAHTLAVFTRPALAAGGE